MPAKLTHEEFINRLDRVYPNRPYEIVGKYEAMDKRILVRNKYGECLSTCSDLLAKYNPTIRVAVDKHSYFVNQLKEVNPTLEIEFIDVYVNATTDLLIKSQFGNCLMSPAKLLDKHSPSIRSAVDKTEYFINKSNIVHNFNYTYERAIYNGDRVKITITCEYHGDFEQTPTHHLQGKGCAKCKFAKMANSIRITIEEVLERFIKVHGNLYDYSFVELLNMTTKVKIICREEDHGIFEQTPDKHSQGNGCPKCFRGNWGYNRSAFAKYCKNETGIMYLIRCWNEVEQFYKMGMTGREIKERFNTSMKMPYQYEIVIEYENTPDKIYDLENELKRNFRSYKYKPLIKFSGASECFSMDLSIEKVKEIINKYE